MNPKLIVASYLVIQAIGTASWWAVLLIFPSTIGWFQPTSFPPEALLGFWLGDFLLLVAGSLVTAIVVIRSVSWASMAIWSLAATVWYPTLYCIGISLITGEAWIAAGLMVCMAGLTLAMATVLGKKEQSPASFRTASLNKIPALIWTGCQVVIFWSVFLAILPLAIFEIEQKIGWISFSLRGQTVVAIIVFISASALGIWSAAAMATVGRGTPLPTATAPELVIAGPYRFIRNPMATAGIVQGLAVGYLLGSYAVIVYAILGGMVWHCCVRPFEENDLKARFGERYVEYQKNVGLWLPKFFKINRQPSRTKVD